MTTGSSLPVPTSQQELKHLPRKQQLGLLTLYKGYLVIRFCHVISNALLHSNLRRLTGTGHRPQTFAENSAVTSRIT